MSKQKLNKNDKTFFKQCHFSTKTENGTKEHVAWIPERLARVGGVVYFGNKSDNPDTLWEVISVGDTKKDGKYLSDHERDYKTQRQASDI